jgi:hypothetical protein
MVTGRIPYCVFRVSYREYSSTETITTAENFFVRE